MVPLLLQLQLFMSLHIVTTLPCRCCPLRGSLPPCTTARHLSSFLLPLPPAIIDAASFAGRHLPGDIPPLHLMQPSLFRKDGVATVHLGFFFRTLGVRNEERLQQSHALEVLKLDFDITALASEFANLISFAHTTYFTLLMIVSVRLSTYTSPAFAFTLLSIPLS